jgi:hypothetical protein
MQSISEFKSNFFGGARNNLFRVNLAWPGAIVAPIGVNLVTDQMMVKGASLPASVIGTIEVPFRGRKLKIAGDRTYESWTITVINDLNMGLRNKFERWMDAISANSINVNELGGLNYMTQLSVEQLDLDQNPIKRYDIYDAYPTNVSNIELNYDTTDAVEEFTVEFNYSYWTSEEAKIVAI